jgi:sulfatase modifying factor 1
LPPSDYISANIGTLKGVPAGIFQRDATAANSSAVSAFRMSAKEITRAQFVAVTGISDTADIEMSVGTAAPVQKTNWYHVLVFCNMLSMAESLAPVYSIDGSTDPAVWIAVNNGIVPKTSNATWDAVASNWSAAGYRLPTEMEWMWAAMGATAGTTGYAKAFAGSTGSNVIEDYAWINSNSDFFNLSVGTKLPNELGLYDMSGNVYEWNWDWYGAYPVGAQTDYRGPASSTHRVIHGGAFNQDGFFSGIAIRTNSVPYGQAYSFGFRVVRK